MKNILLSCVGGNALEWYDFALYAYFAGTIGRVAFPQQSDSISLLIKTYGIFFAGFLTRPLGGILFGYIGDVYGRKKALMLSIYLMAIPTALIGCLPTYASVGYWSPIFLAILRLLQGLSMGGEFTGTMIFVVESAPEQRKSFWGSWASLSAVLGLIMGSGMGTLITSVLAREQIETWGWRVPFILSLLGSWIASSMRQNLHESHPTSQRKNLKEILRELFDNHISTIKRIILIDAIVAVGFFIIYTYNAVYLHEILHIDRLFCSALGTMGLVVSAFILPLAGWAGDRYGPRKVMRFFTGALFLISIPSYAVFTMPVRNIPLIAVCYVLMCLCMASIFAVMPALLVSMFPSSVRYSGISIAHNTCMALLGGSAPHMATFLIDWTGHQSAPGLLLAMAALISFRALEETK